MPATVSTARSLVTEVLTESATAEIAVAAIAVAAALFIFGAMYHHTSLRSTMIRGAGLLLALLTLSVQVHSNGWLTGLDAPVTDWMVEHRSGTSNTIAVAVTNLGSPLATAILGVGCGVFASWRARSVIPGVVVVTTVGAAAVASAVIKAVVGRERPPVDVRELLETDHSFPSGHVTGTAALIGIAVLVLSVSTTVGARRFCVILAAMVTVVVALTRLYLGVHWLTDVIAGALLGSLAVTVGGAVFRSANAPRHSRSDPHMSVAGAHEVFHRKLIQPHEPETLTTEV